jgi:hypothetical protein
MEYLLDSPLEALALNYLSVGFLTVVNNLWTWVAVITAAVSFWRIRAAGGAPTYLKSDGSPPPPRNDQRSSGSELVPETSVSDVSADEPPAPAPASEMMVGYDVKVDDGVTKGTKFVAVFYGEDDREGDGELTSANEWEESTGEDEGCGEWWEGVLRTRTGEMGWYRYQDLTVLNGNVVRLWDSSSCSRSLRYSSSCVAW